MRVMKTGEDNVDDGLNINRLLPNSENKIYIGISDEITGREKENINKMLEEYNNAFLYINDAYCFETCSLNETGKYRKNNKTTIDFKYTRLTEGVYGKAIQNYFKEGLFTINNCYYSSSTIYLDKDVFTTLVDDVQMYILKHEFAHTLGFDDLYEYYDDETSIVNVGIMGLSTHLSPNDFKMLYVAYGNKHINTDGSFNQEKLDEFKQIIKKYERKYYDYLINNIRKTIVKNKIALTSTQDEKSENNIQTLQWIKEDINIEIGGSYPKIIFQDISQDEINGLTFTKGDAQIVINGDSFTYTVDGKTQTRKLVMGEDYVVLPDILTNSPYDKKTPYNDFLTLFKIDDKISCYDFVIYHKLSPEKMKDDDNGVDIRAK